MPKSTRKASDYDFNRIQDMQQGRPSGKGRDARGGNMRVNMRLYDEGMDQIETTCSNCGATRRFGGKCDECGSR